MTRDPLRADCRVIDVDGRGCGGQSAGIIVYAPRAVSIRVARVNVLDVPQLRPVLPDGYPPRSTCIALVESFDIEPAPNGNGHDILSGLLKGRVRMVVT